MRSFVAALIAVIVVIIVYFIVPTTPILPAGILLPIGRFQAPVSPNQVTFYNANTTPLTYRSLALVNVQLHSKLATRESELLLVQYIQKLVSAAGANGVKVSLFGHTAPGQVPNAQQSYVFRGLAVYTVPSIGRIGT